MMARKDQQQGPMEDDKIDQEPVGRLIGRRKWTWIGYMLRKQKDHITCLVSAGMGDLEVH